MSRPLPFTAVSSTVGEFSQFRILLGQIRHTPPYLRTLISVSTSQIIMHAMIQQWSFEASTAPLAPSHQLVQALLALSEAVEQLGIAKGDPKWNGIMQKIFNLFVISWMDKSHPNSGLQGSYDSAFLRNITAGYSIEHMNGSANSSGSENEGNVRLSLYCRDQRYSAFCCSSRTLMKIPKKSSGVYQIIWRVHRLFLPQCFLSLQAHAYATPWAHQQIYYHMVPLYQINSHIILH